MDKQEFEMRLKRSGIQLGAEEAIEVVQVVCEARAEILREEQPEAVGSIAAFEEVALELGCAATEWLEEEAAVAETAAG